MERLVERCCGLDVGRKTVTARGDESTRVYWKSVYYLLGDAFTVLLVNAQHMKKVPGRKRDFRDCAWIAELLEDGLSRASFVPPPRSSSFGI